MYVLTEIRNDADVFRLLSETSSFVPSKRISLVAHDTQIWYAPMNIFVHQLLWDTLSSLGSVLPKYGYTSEIQLIDQ
jgi:hypothetical protein